MDGADDARRGGGDLYARLILIGKQRLSELHAVARLYGHRRLEAVVIRPDDGNAVHDGGIVDLLSGGAGNRQIQAAFDFMHRCVVRFS